MTGARVTFGKRGVSQVSPSPTRATKKSTWSILAAGSAVAVLISGAAVALLSAGDMPFSVDAADKTAITPSSIFSLNGLWSLEGETCEEARKFLELKDGRSALVSPEIGLRIDTFTYALSGTNPLTLTMADGSSVVWEASDANYLRPISMNPQPENGSMDSMLLRRC